MPSAAEQLSTVTLTANGEVFQDWESFSLSERFDDPLGSFDCTIKPAPGKLAQARERLRLGTLVSISVNNAPQMTALITTLDTTISNQGGVTLTASGKNPLCLAYESSIDPRKFSLSSSSDTSVEGIVLEVLSQTNLYNAKIVQNSAEALNVLTGKPVAGGRGPELPIKELKTKDAQAQDNETVYAYLSRILTRLGVCLRLSPTGDLLLSAPHYDQGAQYALVCAEDRTIPGDRFVDGVQVRESNDQQFTEIQVRGESKDQRGQKRSARPAYKLTGEEYAQEAGFNRPPYQQPADVNFSKPLILRDKNSRDIKYCKNVATLAYGLRSPNAFSVSGGVGGFVSQTGAIWSVDTIAKVSVPSLGVDDEMWVYERTLRLDANGQRTSMKLLPKHAFQIGSVSGT